MRQIDYMPDGVTAGYDRTITYNGAGQIDTETVISRQGTETWKNVTTNQYGTGTNYALGAVTYSSTTASKLSNGYYAQQYVSTSTNDFYWFEGAAVANTYVTRTGMTGSSSIFYYNEVGELQYASVGGSRPRTVYYKNGIDGQVLRRDEYDNYTSAGDPHEAWYRFGGKQMGYVGNNGTEDQDYTASIAQRTAAQSTWAFRNGSLSHTAHADFDQSLAPINSYSRGTSGGSYLVQSGDTLAGIAAQLWGDSSLWYKIADANGLAANAALTGGQRLTIPSGVMKNTHNAGTFTPYDPSEALGDVGPSPIPRGKSNKCGFFGAILMVAVAVAVAAVTSGAFLAVATPGLSLGGGITAALGGTATLGAGAAGGAMAVGTKVVATTFGLAVGGALGGAAGSIASQGLGLLTGMQDKFSFKNVALSAIAGGVGGAVGKVMPDKLFGSAFLANTARGAAGSFVTQGIAVATGLQTKFDWAGVAASAIGSGVAGSLSRSAAVDKNLANASEHLRGAASSMAGAIANGAVRSLLNGSNFGDNILAAFPDVIGSTLGNVLAAGLRQQTRQDDFADILVSAQGPAQSNASPRGAAADDEIVVNAPQITDADRQFWLQRDLVNLRLDLQESKDDLQRDLSRLRPNQIANRQAGISRQQSEVDRLEGIHRRAIDLAKGRTVTLKEGGRQAVGYQILGPTARFDTVRDAARDGIALSFEVARILGDSWERGAAISRRPDGGYTYGALEIGVRASRTYRVSGQEVPRGTPMMRLTYDRNTVAGYFHIHPGAPNLGAENRTFSDTDRGFYDRNFLDRRLESYLGGNNGSFMALVPRVDARNRIRGSQIMELQPGGYFSVPKTVRLPTDMHGEPR
jgi:hypothetical protein